MTTSGEDNTKLAFWADFYTFIGVLSGIVGILLLAKTWLGWGFLALSVVSIFFGRYFLYKIPAPLREEFSKIAAL